jgi:prepilin-type N-terminal cleavage/methylation domain-containing protein
VKRRKSTERGFTFLEIIIALMILATSSGILIGLESATLRRTIQDRSTQQAMLAARRIMSAIETSEPSKLSGFDAQPLLVALEQLGAPPPATETEKTALDRFLVSLQLEPFPLALPNMEPNPLLMISLRISWDDRPTDAFSLQYLIPAEEEDPAP